MSSSPVMGDAMTAPLDPDLRKWVDYSRTPGPHPEFNRRGWKWQAVHWLTGGRIYAVALHRIEKSTLVVVELGEEGAMNTVEASNGRA